MKKDKTEQRRKLSRRIFKRDYFTYINLVTQQKILLERIHLGLVNRTIYRHFARLQDQDTNLRKLGSGRDKKYDSSTAKLIVNKVESEEYITAKEISNSLKEEGVAVSESTVTRTLKDLGFEYKKPKTAILLNDQQKYDRLQWCLKHKEMNWETVLFADETVFRAGPSRKYKWMK